jgi:hypothetical protein
LLGRKLLLGVTRAPYSDTRPNEIGEMRKLGINQILDLHPPPFVPEKKVLIG